MRDLQKRYHLIGCQVLELVRDSVAEDMAHDATVSLIYGWHPHLDQLRVSLHRRV